MIVVLTLATGAVLHAQERGTRSPEAAVEAYVQLIEAGDVEAATSMVPVRTDILAADVEESRRSGHDLGQSTGAPVRVEAPVFLSNRLYATTEAISDVSVEPVADQGRSAVGEEAEVAVTYSVGGRSS
ncbi:hypothetical protein, partial [Actinosynnema sp.]|uniref:hypothetical protein n=1 Tax=Actinosynnema sp. TaxID=1872144 RepID=UPI003F843B09